MRHGDQILVFARFPEIGRCKTRLAKGLGKENALLIYRALLDHTLAVVKSSPGLGVLFADPDEHVADAPEWAAGMDAYHPQGPGNLGEKLARAVRKSFAEGARRVILIGCDCPQISKDSVVSSFQALEQHDVVLGPTNDGGYYLIGMKESLAFLFQGIPWSSEKVLEKTLNALNFHSLSYILLDIFSDVDTQADFDRVRHLEPLKNLGIK